MNYRAKAVPATSDANGVAGDVLIPKIVYVKGRRLIGTMPNNAGDVAAVSGHYSTTNIHIIPAAGYVDGTDDAATLSLANLKPVGMTAWYDANQIVGLSNGDDVSTWADASGNGYDATQGTADNKPHYTTNIINGYPVVRFDGTNDVLAISGSTATFKFLHAGDSTVFGVVKFGTGSNPNAYYGLIGNNKGSTGNKGFRFYFDDRAAVPVNNAVGFGVTNGSAGQNVISNALPEGCTPNAWHIIWVRNDIDNAIAAYRSRMLIDGGIEVIANAANSGASANDASFDTDIGGGGGGTFPLTGDIAEIIIYNSICTPQQVGAVILYLQAKYGITLT